MNEGSPSQSQAAGDAAPAPATLEAKTGRRSRQRKAKGDSSWPIIVNVSGVVARIYRNPVRAKGQSFESYLVRHPVAGKRTLANTRFSDLAKARLHAQTECERVLSGLGSVAGMRNEDAASYAEAAQLLAKASVSLPVHVAIRDYVEALKLLPPGATLADAAKFLAARHPASGPPRMVPKVVDEFIADRRSAGCSEIHLRDLRIRLTRFGDTFQVPITAVTAPQVADYLGALKNAKTTTAKAASNRSRANHRALIVALFNFAKLRRYVSRDQADEIAEIPVPKFRTGEVEVFTPAEFRRLLEAADEELRPAIAVGGLAGLRVAEIARLDWRSIKLDERVIVVGGDIAKTASRRVVPIGEALAAWLTPHKKPFGRVFPAEGEGLGVGDALVSRCARLATRAGIEWKRNALRHSFGSYRLSVTADLARVALEMGNSPSVINAHYRALTTEAEGKKWF
jgi:integrase